MSQITNSFPSPLSLSLVKQSSDIFPFFSLEWGEFHKPDGFRFNPLKFLKA